MLNELATFPLFLRFDNVKVSIVYNLADQPIEERCKFIESQLLPIKFALYDSNMVEFIADIFQENRNHFSDHSKLLDYIRNRFLPICNSFRRYKFKIGFNSAANSGTDITASILQMDEIKHCLNVEIRLFDGGQKRLPVEEISNWLEPFAAGTKNTLQNQKERLLTIYHIGPFTIQNAREMLEHLAKVYFLRPDFYKTEQRESW